MNAADTIVNKVANSGLVSLDLEAYYHPGERVLFDLAPVLFQGMILREADFRAFVKEHDFGQYAGKNVAVVCSADAIVPTWAYMLLANKLQPHAHFVVFGDLAQLENSLFQAALQQLDLAEYSGKKVVVKGCSKHPVPVFAYTELTRLLTPVVSSLMFGEPCSTVPIYKKK